MSLFLDVLGWVFVAFSVVALAVEIWRFLLPRDY